MYDGLGHVEAVWTPRHPARCTSSHQWLMGTIRADRTPGLSPRTDLAQLLARLTKMSRPRGLADETGDGALQDALKGEHAVRSASGRESPARDSVRSGSLCI